MALNIEKQSEAFRITEVTEDGWKMEGNATKSVDGAININMRVNQEIETSINYIGELNYYKSGESNMTSINMSASEGNRDKMTAYADSVIDQVLATFTV